MPEITNLAERMEKQLPLELVGFMRRAGEVAARQGQSLYLVGGVVRDLLLGRSNLDLDLVIEGDAINLAQQLAGITQGKIITHPRFNTAKLQWNNWSVDLATARSETYSRPGALPSVKPGSLASDLFRRDFTINTMALKLVPNSYGDLIDSYGGQEDLKNRLIRVLHEKSFTDDATRIWRGLRYEQRLGFQLEAGTLKLLKRDIPMLDTISGDRIRHELELILKEELPEKALHRADGLGVLARLQPALKGDDWLAERFGLARQLSSPKPPPVELYMALLAYRLNNQQTEDLIAYLRPPRLLTQTLRDSQSLKAELDSLADPNLAPSRIYQFLNNHSPTAITVNSLATDSPVVRQHLQTFLTKLRCVRPALTGNDLKKLGIAPGPRMKEILQRLFEAKLDGKVTSKKDEEGLVERVGRVDRAK